MSRTTDSLRKALGLDSKPKPKRMTPEEIRSIAATQTDMLQNYLDRWYKKKKLPNHRVALYKIYDDLDELVPEIGGFLDTMSAEATQLNEERGHKVWATCKKARVLKRIEDLLYRKLKVDEWATSTVRSLGKYGDDFGEVLYDKDGVQGVFWGVPLTELVRVETADGQLMGFALRKDIQDKIGGDPNSLKKSAIAAHVSKPWDYVHFRIMTEKRYSSSDPMPVLYGTSMLRRAIRPAYRLDIIHDLLLAYRASKSVDRFILKIDVTGQLPDEMYETLMKWKQWLYQMTYENKQTGEFTSMGNPLAVGEDIIWPVTENSQSDIDTLQGNPNLYEALDVDMAVTQFYGALSAPKGLFGYDDNVEGNRTYASQSVSFAKTCFKGQSAFMDGIDWLLRIDLAYAQEELRLSDEDLVDPDLFHLHMVPPSAILHLNRLEALRDVLDAARDMLDLAQELDFDDVTRIEWQVHTLRSILGMTDFDIEHFADALDNRIKQLKKELKVAGLKPGEQPEEGEGAPSPPGVDTGAEEPAADDGEVAEEQYLPDWATKRQPRSRKDLPTPLEEGDAGKDGKDRVVLPWDMFEKDEDEEDDEVTEDNDRDAD